MIQTIRNILAFPFELASILIMLVAVFIGDGYDVAESYFREVILGE